MIYDASDDDTGVSSTLHGPSLLRSVFGINDLGGNYSTSSGTGRTENRQVPPPPVRHRGPHQLRFDAEIRARLRLASGPGGPVFGDY